MKYYFAARYSRNEEMRRYRDILQSRCPSAIVTSRWIDQHGGNVLNSIVASKLNSNPLDCWQYGLKDLEDIIAAQTVVSFTGNHDGNGKGGRHIEFGYGLALYKRMIIVGQRENIFHTHPRISTFGSFDDFLENEAGRYE